MRHMREWCYCVLALAFAAVGCNSEGGPAAGETRFESDGPSADSSRSVGRPESASDDFAGGGPTGAPGAAPPTTPGSVTSDGANSSSGEAARAISEADVIQLQGDRLYALSRTAGLAVVDVADPAALKLLGRYRELPAQPFELYLHGDVALVMFSGWGQYAVQEDGNYSWVTTSKLVTLDVSNPAAIAALDSFDIPGSISDSRIVGDVLYIVGHEDGYCWGCEQNQARTSIVSLRVSDPRAVSKVDTLYFGDSTASGGARSVTVTNTRMYVAGPEYGQSMPTGSTIQVVDISDHAGDLVLGAQVPVEGMITSRWQMDEYNGVLRVISQPPTWWTIDRTRIISPAVQTFQVKSSNELVALGRTDIRLPKPESLRSVRFDGTRAYAITAEQIDPLFVIDLSQPAQPKQMGEIEIPGFIYHMEPRGERLLGLGFDQNNRAGSITVSLFDVADMATPKLLSRVNFGGTWGSLPADQDRIHKVFRVLDDKGLILVPFSGWDYSGAGTTADEYCGYSRYVGGVQLVDFQNDTLRARGTAPSRDQTQRALLAHDRLLSVSDERVEAFDVDNRDNPQLVSQVVLSRQIASAYQLDGDLVARFSYDARNGGQVLDLVDKASASDPNVSFGELALADLTATPVLQCKSGLNIENTFVDGSRIQLLYSSSAYDARGNSESTRGLLILDTSAPSKPTVVSNTAWSNGQNWSPYYGFYSYGYYGSTSAIARTQGAIGLLESSWTYDATGTTSTQHTRLRVVDVRDQANVKTTTLALNLTGSYSGLQAHGSTVVTSHFEPSGANTSRGRFYLDRFDLSDPQRPTQQASINVPGTLLNYLGDVNRAITSEQVTVRVENTTSDECYDRFASAQWSYPTATNGANPAVRAASAPAAGTSTPSADGSASSGTSPQVPVEPVRGLCVGHVQRLHLVRLEGDSAVLEDTLELAEDQQVFSSSLGEGVLFASIGRGGGGYYPRGPVATTDIACFSRCGGTSTSEPSSLLVLGGFASGKFVTGTIKVEAQNGDNNSGSWWGFWGTPTAYAVGQRALLVGQSDVAIIDASTPSAPRIERRVPLFAPANHVNVRGDTALLSLGTLGVQWLSVSQ